MEIKRTGKDMKEVNLSNSYNIFIVDDEDYFRVKQHTWRLNSKNICTTINNKTISIGNFIVGTVFLMEVDHIDRNIFNNQRLNLRVCTKQENCINRDYTSINTSGYRGVSWHKYKHKWSASIQNKGIKIYLGDFYSKEDAARAYNIAAIKHHKEFAVLNKINQPTGQEICINCRHKQLLHNELNQECSACDTPEVPMDKKCPGFKDNEQK